MSRYPVILIALLATLLGFARARAANEPASPRDEVVATEAAFAATMAERSLDRFAEHVAADAVFFSRGGVLRGRQAVVDGWRAFFADAAAPFSWAPDKVEVLASGDLAMSIGPVFDPTGKKFATFTSVWRRDPDGRWRIIFDKGDPVVP